MWIFVQKRLSHDFVHRNKSQIKRFSSFKKNMEFASESWKGQKTLKRTQYAKIFSVGDQEKSLIPLTLILFLSKSPKEGVS